MMRCISVRWARVAALISLSAWLGLPSSQAVHFMKREPVHYVAQDSETRPLDITNLCADDIFPAIGTQAGTGPSTNGFKLKQGESKSLTVSPNWQGRVWGRTNCSFNDQGTGPSKPGGLNGGVQACVTGDCGGLLDCKVTGETPVTLAEFAMSSGQNQAFYDISLVDGYNLPMAITSIWPSSKGSNFTRLPPNLTNPVCIGTGSELRPDNSSMNQVLGTNATYPLPLESKQTVATLNMWCPWEYQLSPPDKPSSGVYPYPDTKIERPLFDPCYSACSKTNEAQFCCTGQYSARSACQVSKYSTNAKAVCPDAYSWAFDDDTSTFIIPQGGGFGVIFCPPGRSSNIIATLGPQMQALASPPTHSRFKPRDLVADIIADEDCVAEAAISAIQTQSSQTPSSRRARSAAVHGQNTTLVKVAASVLATSAVAWWFRSG